VYETTYPFLNKLNSGCNLFSIVGSLTQGLQGKEVLLTVTPLKPYNHFFTLHG